MSSTLVSINPSKCCLWKLHDRRSPIDEQACKAEIESFARSGQLVPVLGRPLCGNSQYDVELIYGARRLFVARHLRQNLLVQVRPLTDRDGIIAMDIENRLRKDISPYERGMSYARWLRSGYFDSQEDIASALQVSASQVSRLLELARLPAVVVGAFRDTGEIRESWGREVMSMLEDPAKRARTMSVARSIGSAGRRPPSGEVYRRLMAASVAGRKPRVEMRDKVVLAKNGEPLFRVRQQSNSIVLILPKDIVSRVSLIEIESALTDILQSASEATRTPATKGLARVRPSNAFYPGGLSNTL
jgi:ParB family transcriptional regulator, chromosome partitioning protein